MQRPLPLCCSFGIVARVRKVMRKSAYGTRIDALQEHSSAGGGAARCQRPPVRGAGLTNLYCVCVLRSRQLGVGEGTGGPRRGGGESSNDTFARRSEARGNNELCT